MLMIEELSNIMQSILNVTEPIEPHRYLPDMGLDSLNMVEFVVRLEQEFDIELNDDDLLLTNFLTLRDVENMLTRYVEATLVPDSTATGVSAMEGS